MVASVPGKSKPSRLKLVAQADHATQRASAVGAQPGLRGLAADLGIARPLLKA